MGVGCQCQYYVVCEDGGDNGGGEFLYDGFFLGFWIFLVICFGIFGELLVYFFRVEVDGDFCCVCFFDVVGGVVGGVFVGWVLVGLFWVWVCLDYQGVYFGVDYFLVVYEVGCFVVEILVGWVWDFQDYVVVEFFGLFVYEVVGFMFVYVVFYCEMVVVLQYCGCWNLY